MKAKISRSQYFFTLPNLVYCKAIGITTGVIVRRIGADVWTAVSIGFLIGTAFALLMTYISSKFPEMTVIQYTEKVCGRLLGKTLGIILTVYFAIAYGFSANVMTLHLKEYFLDDTPFLIMCLFYTLLCTYGVILGIEVSIRFAFFGFLMIMGINVTMMLGTIGDFRLENLQPLLDQGLKANLFSSVYIFSDIAMAILAIGMLYPMLNSKKKAMLMTFWAMIVGAVIVIIWPLFEVGVLGADTLKQFVVVCMQQVRSAQLTRYLPRYELIMVSFFVWGAFVQSVAMYWCSIYSLKQTVGIKKDWMLIVSYAPTLTLITNYIGRDHNRYVRLIAYPWSQISAALSIGLPLLLLIIIAMKKMFKRAPKGKTQASS